MRPSKRLVLAGERGWHGNSEGRGALRCCPRAGRCTSRHVRAPSLSAIADPRCLPARQHGSTAAVQREEAEFEHPVSLPTGAVARQRASRRRAALLGSAARLVGIRCRRCVCRPAMAHRSAASSSSPLQRRLAAASHRPHPGQTNSRGSKMRDRRMAPLARTSARPDGAAHISRGTSKPRNASERPWERSSASAPLIYALLEPSVASFGQLITA
jgi:hypothetical protein